MFYWSRSLTSFNQRQLRAWLVSALKLPKMVTKLLARSCVRQARYAKNIFRNFARLIETFCGWPQSSCGPPSVLLCGHSNCWQAPAIEQCGQLQRGPATKASLTCFLLVLPSPPLEIQTSKFYDTCGTISVGAESRKPNKMLKWKIYKYLSMLPLCVCNVLYVLLMCVRVCECVCGISGV